MPKCCAIAGAFLRSMALRRLVVVKCRLGGVEAAIQAELMALTAWGGIAWPAAFTHSIAMIYFCRPVMIFQLYDSRICHSHVSTALRSQQNHRYTER